MNLNKTQTGLLLLLLSVGSVRAQEAVPATGGSASGSNGNMSYSVGQVVYTAGSGTNGSVIQGVQQPYSISSAGIGEELENIRLTVFPNPATDVLNLSLEETEITGYSYALYNQQGQLVRSSTISEAQTTIPVQDLKAANYVLNVTQGEEVVKSFKLIKH